MFFKIVDSFFSNTTNRKRKFNLQEASVDCKGKQDEQCVTVESNFCLYMVLLATKILAIDNELKDSIEIGMRKHRKEKEVVSNYRFRETGI